MKCDTQGTKKGTTFGQVHERQVFTSRVRVLRWRFSDSSTSSPDCYTYNSNVVALLEMLAIAPSRVSSINCPAARCWLSRGPRRAKLSDHADELGAM